MINIVKLLTKSVLMAVFAFVGGFFIASVTFEWLYGPRQQDVYEAVSESVIRVVAPTLGEGTAFSVRAASGNKYLITNAHVCEQLARVSSYAALWIDNQEFKIPLTVKAISDKYDLCAVTLQADVMVPLQVEDSYYENQRIFVAGFPMVPFLSVVEGRVGGLMSFKLPYNTSVEACVGPKFQVEKISIPTPDGSMRVAVCFMRGLVLTTTAIVDLGNSGSPVLNERMKVIGVVMMSRGLAVQAGAVPAKALLEFLSAL